MEEIRFNKYIYNEKAIKISMADFSELAVFSVEKNDDYFVVSVNDINKDFLTSIKNEFSNYVLAKTIQF